MNIFILLRRK